MTTTTLAEIRSHGPCEAGFAKIRDHLGVSPAHAKTHSEPFPVALLLDTNGLMDALWVTAHVAPDALARFLIRCLDDGDHSALKVLRALDRDYPRQIAAVEAVADLLRRKLAGEDVCEELRAASDEAALAAYAAAHAALAAGEAADAASDEAALAAYAAAHAALAAGEAADAAGEAARAASAAADAADAAVEAADAAADAAAGETARAASAAADAASDEAARADLIAALRAE